MQSQVPLALLPAFGIYRPASVLSGFRGVRGLRFTGFGVEGLAVRDFTFGGGGGGGTAL